MILIYWKVPGRFEICPGKVGNFLSSCREVKSAHSGNTVGQGWFETFFFLGISFNEVEYVLWRFREYNLTEKKFVRKAEIMRFYTFLGLLNPDSTSELLHNLRFFKFPNFV